MTTALFGYLFTCLFVCLWDENIWTGLTWGPSIFALLSSKLLLWVVSAGENVSILGEKYRVSFPAAYVGYDPGNSPGHWPEAVLWTELSTGIVPPAVQPNHVCITRTDLMNGWCVCRGALMLHSRVVRLLTTLRNMYLRHSFNLREPVVQGFRCLKLNPAS